MVPDFRQVCLSRVADPSLGPQTSRAKNVYFNQRNAMPTETLIEIVRTLTQHEQQAVRQFIEYLKKQDATPTESPFVNAAEKFMSQHPELLRRLAQ